MIQKLEKFLLRPLFIMGLLFCSAAVGKAFGQASTTFSDKEAETFITEWIKLSQDNKNFDAVMMMYAEEVEFYKLGTVKKSALAEDKRKYFDRWPQREHGIISIVLHAGSQRNEKQAEVIFHYKIRKGPKSLEGDAQTLILLRKTRGRVSIISEKDLPAASATSSSPATDSEYLVWSGYGGTAWIDQQGAVLKKSREKVPITVVNDALYSIRVEKRTVKQADCFSADSLRDPDAKPNMKNAAASEAAIIRTGPDGKEHRTVLIKAEDSDAGEADTGVTILGLVGPWLFIDRQIYFYPCGAPHGATAHELIIVNVETNASISAYPGQTRNEMEGDILGPFAAPGRTLTSSPALFSGKEYGEVLSALSRKAKRDMGDNEDDEFKVTRIKPTVDRDSLQLEVLLTASTSYAGSDGEWSSYTRSVAYPSPFIPEVLKPYQNIPPAVLKWWKAGNNRNYPSWSVIPSSGPLRQQLEKLFQ